LAELPDGARAWLGGRALPWARFGRWPTPVTELSLDDERRAGRAHRVWVKREDLSHPRYGGNKLRTLEVLLGDAAARGVTRVWATGAYGSNHAVATLVHAEAAGVRAGALLFPQPYSEAAADNLRSCLSSGAEVRSIAHVAALPFAMARGFWRDRRSGERPWMMPPGGATPLGALGAFSAAFELAEQVRGGELPPPATLVVAAGSTCTTAGLLGGLTLAARLGVWRWPRPRVHAVRVAPWPVTSHYRVSALAFGAVELADRLRGERSGITRSELGAQLVVDGSQLGPGYGRGTAAGEAATRRFAAAGGPALDSVYSAKSGAALLALLESGARRGPGGSGGPVLLWSTKSAAPAPTGPRAEVPRRFARWLTSGARRT
jgi:D-cysteine desulfhydrase